MKRIDSMPDQLKEEIKRISEARAPKCLDRIIECQREAEKDLPVASGRALSLRISTIKVA
jgi:hypothetical protein